MQVVQVVGDAARADHQHAFRAQRRQCAAHRKLVGRAQFRLDRQRHHRDVGLRVEHAQRHPDAMVQAALRVLLRMQASQFQQARHLLRQRRGARGRISISYNGGGKPPKS